MTGDGGVDAAHERVHFVGWLRVFLITLVVAHHAAEPYNAAGGEWRMLLDDPARSDVLLYLFLLNRTFFMGFFFLIAGYFLAASFDRRGAWGFAVQKLLRLGVPLLVVVVFGFGSIGYGIYGEGSGYLRWVWRDYLLGGNAEYGPLWFTAHLLAYCLIYAALRAATGWQAPALPAPGHGAVLGFVLLLGAATALLRPVFPIDEWVRLAGNVPAEPGRVPQYLGLFIVGILAGRGAWFATLDARVAAVWGPTGVGVFAVAATTGLPRMALADDVAVNMIWGLLESFVGVGVILGLVGLFRAVCNAPGPWLRRLEPLVYGIYLIHIFVVIALQMALTEVAWPALAKFALSWLPALLISALLVAGLRAIPGVRRVI